LWYNSLITEPYINQLYENIFTKEKLNAFYQTIKKWEWLSISINLALFVIKILFVSICLYCGLFLLSDYNKPYNICFNIAIKSEFVFVIYVLYKILQYHIGKLPESIEELQVMPLSLMTFFDPALIEPWLIYPLNTLNLFEVLYVLMLSALMAVAIQVKFGKAFDLVFVSYGAGLLLMMVAQMFLILNQQ
jgi:hypothetical protein